METFRCVVAIPTRKLFDQDVYYASVPSEDGMYGVLPGHELLVALNGESGICTLNLDKEGTKQESFLVHKGATQMYNGILTVLAEFGKRVEDIDLAEVKQSAEEIKARIAELEASEEDSQAESELSTSKRRLKWYEIQIQYAEEHQK
jgi:F-type H+-transporting ATPase subunit epsilon